MQKARKYPRSSRKPAPVMGVFATLERAKLRTDPAYAAAQRAEQRKQAQESGAELAALLLEALAPMLPQARRTMPEGIWLMEQIAKGGRK